MSALKKSVLISAQTIFLLLLLSAAFPAAAEGMVDDMFKEGQPAEEQQQTEQAAVSSAVALSPFDYIKMIAGLLLVLALLYAVLKFLNSKNRSFQHNALIQNLGGVQLGNQKSVQLLKVGDALFIVGVGEDISLMKEVTDEEEKARLLTIYAERQEMTAAPHIAELFGKARTKWNGRKNGEKFDAILKDRLDDMKKKRSAGLDDWKEQERK